MGLSGDEGSKDPIYPRLSFSQLPWEIRGGMMTQRLRIRSHCLLPVSLCHPWLLCGRIPFSLLQSPHSEGESISKSDSKFGSFFFFHDFCHSSSVQFAVRAGEGKARFISDVCLKGHIMAANYFRVQHGCSQKENTVKIKFHLSEAAIAQPACFCVSGFAFHLSSKTNLKHISVIVLQICRQHSINRNYLAKPNHV